MCYQNTQDTATDVLTCKHYLYVVSSYNGTNFNYFIYKYYIFLKVLHIHVHSIDVIQHPVLKFNSTL